MDACCYQKAAQMLFNPMCTAPFYVGHPCHMHFSASDAKYRFRNWQSELSGATRIRDQPGCNCASGGALQHRGTNKRLWVYHGTVYAAGVCGGDQSMCRCPEVQAKASTAVHQ